MHLKDKILHIFLNAIPVILMIALIPFVANDFVLAGFYLVIIAISLTVRYNKNDYLFLIFGFLALTVSEYFFVSTGVETFQRKTLFGIMPLWLPILWGYVFIAIKRSIVILDK
jgi:hypothetical protein